MIIADFGGTVNPVKLDGDVYSETTGFEIFDRAYHDTGTKTHDRRQGRDGPDALRRAPGLPCSS